MYHYPQIPASTLFDKKALGHQIGHLLSGLWFSIRKYDGQDGITERAGPSLETNVPRCFISNAVYREAKEGKVYVPSTVREYNDIWLELVESLCHWEQLTGRKASMPVPVSHLENPPLNIPQ